MIAGIGTDIVEVNRIERAAARLGDKFLNRLFTMEERSYCDGHRGRWQCYAARFAAKEAVLKALGTGLACCRWTEIEVINWPSGRPGISLSGGAARLARDRGIGEILISLAHDGDRALAFAVAVTAKGEGGSNNAGGNGCGNAGNG